MQADKPTEARIIGEGPKYFTEIIDGSTEDELRLIRFKGDARHLLLCDSIARQ